jgi:hypothetical protein
MVRVPCVSEDDVLHAAQARLSTLSRLIEKCFGVFRVDLPFAQE